MALRSGFQYRPWDRRQYVLENTSLPYCFAQSPPLSLSAAGGFALTQRLLSHLPHRTVAAYRYTRALIPLLLQSIPWSLCRLKMPMETPSPYRMIIRSPSSMMARSLLLPATAPRRIWEPPQASRSRTRYHARLIEAATWPLERLST